MTTNKEKNQKEEDVKTFHKIQSLASVLFERSCSRFQAIQETVDPNSDRSLLRVTQSKSPCLHRN
jgi:hypothetical protein